MGGSGFYLESNWKSCCNIYDRYCSRLQPIFQLISCNSILWHNIVDIKLNIATNYYIVYSTGVAEYVKAMV